MKRIRLTAAQALVRFLGAQQSVGSDGSRPLFAGVFAIFGHGNVAGIGEALQHVQSTLPTFRAHNEQAMAHAAIAFAKANFRRRMMACTTSVGPGATNMITAAALAHVNRLPVLLLPGDVFANRVPDPVLQQVEVFGDPTISANDCFRPVSRFWDRISRPEQLIASLPQALSVLLDPVDCGPVTLCMPEDVQVEAFDYPESLFETRVHEIVRPQPDPAQLARAAQHLRAAQKPLIIAGGGVLYSTASEALGEFAQRHGIPVAETQAGKGALRWDHASNVGAIGVTGSSTANSLAAEADVILAIGTRLADFTTASAGLFANPECRIVSLNVCRHDASKLRSAPIQGDALSTLPILSDSLNGYESPPRWREFVRVLQDDWQRLRAQALISRSTLMPSDAEVLGIVNAAAEGATVVCAAGGLPGELHKLWRADGPGSYHVEYGYSCMGYEIAGGLGVKLAQPQREVIVLVGDGSYLMMNSEIATSVALGLKLIIVILDNRGFGCINRLQRSVGGAPFNNLLDDRSPRIDFAAHARSMGAIADKVQDLSALERALRRAREAATTYAIVIDTDPEHSTAAGGSWWDVPVAEVSESPAVQAARAAYERRRGR